MPKGIERPRPAHDDIVAALKEAGSVNGAATRLGVPEPTLRRWIRADPELQAALDASPELAAPAPGDPVRREEVLAARVKELEAQIRGARKDDVREERVIQTLERLVPVARRTYTPAPRPKSRRSGKQALVLQFSDLHAGEIVSLEQTNGLNEYDWQIMLARLDRLRERLLSWRDVFGDIDHLYIAWLGDMVSGDIHDELAETNEVPLDESVVRLGMDAGAWIESLVPEFPKITIGCVDGNHSRRHSKPRAKNRYSNADWQCAHFAKLHLRNYDTVSFEVPSASRHVLDVYGRKLLLVHGDGVRSTMQGVPWGGWNRRSQSWHALFEHDHTLIGHFHEVNVTFGGRIYVNGSLKGADEYSLSNYGAGDKPRQQLIPFHSEHGAGGALWLDV